MTKIEIAVEGERDGEKDIRGVQLIFRLQDRAKRRTCNVAVKTPAIFFFFFLKISAYQTFATEYLMLE